MAGTSQPHASRQCRHSTSMIMVVTDDLEESKPKLDDDASPSSFSASSSNSIGLIYFDISLLMVYTLTYFRYCLK